MTTDTATAGAVDRLAGLVGATEGDRRARRRLLDRASRVLAADAEAERRARFAIAEAEQRAKAVEADAEARIRAAEARLHVQQREREASRAEREAQRAADAAAREDRAERAALRSARYAAARDACGAAAPAVLSMLVYGAAVASAVFGQVTVATGRYAWPMWRGLLLAAFIELMALAMALTANRLRLRGERAFAPRVLTWVFASFAAAVNVWGHWTDPLMAAGLGAASLGGITLWEIRSSARHRDALRAAGQLAEPMPRLGWRMWVLRPRIAAGAYRLAVRAAVSDAAAPLIAEAEAQRVLRRSARVLRGGKGAAAALPAALAASEVAEGAAGAADADLWAEIDARDPWAAAVRRDDDSVQRSVAASAALHPQQLRAAPRRGGRSAATVHPLRPVRSAQRSTAQRGAALTDDQIAAAIRDAVAAARRGEAEMPSQRELIRIVATQHPTAPVVGPRRIDRIAAEIAAPMFAGVAS